MSDAWPGQVVNKSSQPLLVIWSKDATSKTKLWFVRVLSPGRKTPGHIDIDGVKGFTDDVKISGSTQWWWLMNGAEVDVETNADGSLKISQTSMVGSLKEVDPKEVDGWPNVNKNLTRDDSWGEKNS